MEWLFSIAASEIVRNWAIVFGGGFGLWMAWARMKSLRVQSEAQAAQAQLAQRAHVAELFRELSGDLKCKEAAVRVAALHGLVELGQEYREPYFEAVASVLRTYKGSKDGLEDNANADSNLTAQEKRLINNYLFNWVVSGLDDPHN